MAAIAASSSLVAMQAAAQDVIVMRRVIAPPTRKPASAPTPAVTPTPTPVPTSTSPTPTPTPVPTSTSPTPAPTPAPAGSYSWRSSEWSQPAAACGASVMESRTVVCSAADGSTVADNRCDGDRPSATRSATATASCSFAWSSGDWSAPTSSCGSSILSRTVSCARSDGQAAPDASCTGERPAATETTTDYSGCAYAWHADAWSDPATTCGTAHETRDVKCLRSDGAGAPDASCAGGSSGAKPETSQDVLVTGGCSYSWNQGDWGQPVPACGATVSSRSVTCVRSDGATATSESLCPSGKPDTSRPATDYSTCSDGRSNAHPYNWTSGDWSAPSMSCGAATETRTVQCLDGSGQVVDAGQCAGAMPAASKTSTETSGCTFSWKTGAYGDAVPACGATIQTRPVYCQRSDGTSAQDASCDAGSRPGVSQPATDYSACTFSWTTSAYGAWSTTCGDATQTRTVTCSRADGTPADSDSKCTGTKPAAVSDPVHQTSGCSYQWVQGGFGAATPACGATTQTQTVTCRRGDGVVMTGSDESLCGTRPPTSQAATDYSTCTFAWSYGAYSAPSSTCGSSTQTRIGTCTRGDGAVMGTTAPTGDTSSCVSSKGAADTTLSTYQTSSCTYLWKPGAWSVVAPACGASTRTRSFTCVRSDNQTMTDTSLCGANSQSATDTSVTDYSTCTFSWTIGQWQGTAGCGNTVTQTRSVSCDRSDGTKGVAASSCPSPTPASSQPITDYSQCSYAWVSTPGTWSSTCSTTATRPETVTCQRQDGVVVADSFCNAGTKPATQDTGNLTGCSYTPTYTLGACVATNPGGLNGTRPATITKCTRSDGTVVGNEQCSVATPSCTLSYAPTYSSTYGSCSISNFGDTSGTQTAPISSCAMTGSDGSGPTSVSTNYCQPQTTSKSCTVTYTYTPTYGAPAACFGGSQTASIASCTGTASNGTSQTVANSNCSPQTQTTTCGTMFSSGFESGDPAAPQTGNPAGTYSTVNGAAVSSTRAYAGSYSMQLVPYNSATMPSTSAVKFYINAVANASYTVTFYAYGISSGNYVYFQTPQGTFVQVATGFSSSNSWVAESFTYSPTVSGASAFVLRNNDTANSIYVDSVVVTKN